ncbi:hypothetical protein [Pilimelia columellifera]|uniref:hypothetical protein n=1 Tax=Pilimelia columellifera TaxID=706574 RepID=UPI0031DEE7F8
MDAGCGIIGAVRVWNLFAPEQRDRIMEALTERRWRRWRWRWRWRWASLPQA